MADINQRERRTARLQVGDRVRMKVENTVERDVGTVIGFTFGAVRVAWDVAHETYTEDAAALERVP